MAHFHIICSQNHYNHDPLNITCQLLSGANHTYYLWNPSIPYDNDSIRNADAVLLITDNWETIIDECSYSIQNEIKRSITFKKLLFIPYKSFSGFSIYKANTDIKVTKVIGEAGSRYIYKSIKALPKKLTSVAETSSDANTTYGKEGRSFSESIVKKYVDNNGACIKGPVRGQERSELIFIQLRDKRLLFRR